MSIDKFNTRYSGHHAWIRKAQTFRRKLEYCYRNNLCSEPVHGPWIRELYMGCE